MRFTATLFSILGFFNLLFLAGCGGGDPAAFNAGSTQTTPEATLDGIREMLYDDTYGATSKQAEKADPTKPTQTATRVTFATYLNVIHQLNNYLDQVPNLPADQTKLLQATPAEDQRLRGLLPTSTRDADMKTLLARSFTTLDAHHLDFCFLFRDAAQALHQHLGGDALEQATEGFAWVMRHVDYQLRPRNVGDWPAHDILRRGTGNSEERLRVFLALLNQLDIEAGTLTRNETITDSQGRSVTRKLPWLAAVLHKDELYLFDTLTGQPVWKDAAKRQVATWREVKTQPKLLEDHYKDGELTFVPAMLEGNELWLEVSITFLSPRMRWLQDRFGQGRSASDLPVKLYQDWDARLKKYDTAKLGIAPRNWKREDRPEYPIQLLAEYVTFAEQQERDLFNLRPIDVVVPWHLLPVWLREDDVPHRRFGGLYYLLMPQQELDRLVQTGKMRETEIQRRLVSPFQRLFQTIRLAPGGHRDQLVRGKPERVVQRIIKDEDVIDRILTQLHTQPLDPETLLRVKWAPDALDLETKFALAEAEYLQARNTKAPDLNAKEQAFNLEGRRREKLWSANEPRLGQMAVEWGQPELRSVMTYYMALAKTDLAVRAEWKQHRQAKDPSSRTTANPTDELSALEQWQSALFWYRRYEAMSITGYSGTWLNAARRQIKECEAAIERLSEKK